MIHNSTEEALTREVPTHLFQFKERIFGFFTVPQLLYDTVAFTVLWYVCSKPLPLILRVAISIIYAIVVLFVVHIPIKKRNITDWVYLYTRFFITPSKAVWCPFEQVTLMQTTQESPVPASVQATWIPLRSIKGPVMSFTQKKARSGKQEEPDRFCTVLEVGGINIGVLSEEEQSRLFASYETFLAGLQFPLQTYSSNENVDIQTYAPILAQVRQIPTLSKTPRLQALTQKSLQFQRKKISSCVTTRHFVIVSSTLSELAIQTTDGKPPSMLTILFTFAWMQRRAKRQTEDTLQELQIRTEVVRKGLTGLGLSVELLRDQRLAQFYAATLCPGSLILPFTQLEHPNPLTYQTQKTG